MPKLNMTEDELKQAHEEMYELTEAISNVLTEKHPVDIPVGKLVERLSMLQSLLPPSRTMVIAAITYAAVNAFPSTLDKDNLIAIFKTIYEATQSKKSLGKVKEAYAVQILEQQAKQAEQEFNKEGAFLAGTTPAGGWN